MENFSADDWGTVESLTESYVRETNKAAEVLGCPACGTRAMKYSFDPEYLRDKYRQERDKRLREDGNDQYQEVSGDFSYFVDDPYINEAIERQACLSIASFI